MTIKCKIWMQFPAQSISECQNLEGTEKGMTVCFYLPHTSTLSILAPARTLLLQPLL